MARLFDIPCDRLGIMYKDKEVGITIIDAGMIPCILDDDAVSAIRGGAKLRLEIVEVDNEEVR